MKIKVLLLAIIALAWGRIESKTVQSQDLPIVSHLGFLQSLSDDAFNNRLFKEAMKIEEVISNHIPKDSSGIKRAISNRADMLLYGAQFMSIDDIWKYSVKLSDEVIQHNDTNYLEYKVLQLRTAYFDALRKYGTANDSIAEIVSLQIKSLAGENSTEYANALLLKSVILLRSIPSSFKVDYETQKRIKGQRMMEAEESIDQALSIYKSQNIPLKHTWPSYALALKETISFEKKWHWPDGVNGYRTSAVEVYGIASNVSSEACSQIYSIFQSIKESDTRFLPNKINALENLAEIHSAIRGHTSLEVRLLILASFFSNSLNNIQPAKAFYDRAKSINNQGFSDSALIDSMLDSLNNDIIQNSNRIALIEDKDPLRGFEEALLIIGSPYYDFLKSGGNKSESHDYYSAPTIDLENNNLNFSNLIRELFDMYSQFYFFDDDILSQTDQFFSKKDEWNTFIEHTRPKASYIWEMNGDEYYYFDNLNKFLGSPLLRIFQSLVDKSNKNFNDYQDMARCCFYLYDFEKAAYYQQIALDSLLESENTDTNLIMTYQRNVTYLMMLDFWYDLWVYSDSPRFCSKSEYLEEKMSKLRNFLKNNPKVFQEKTAKMIASAQKFSYEAIPYLYDLLPILSTEERVSLWKDFSDWFYTIMPLLSFNPGMEEVLYDIQLFSKGLLLETSKNTDLHQYRWTDVRNNLKSDEIAIEFIKSYEGYCAAVIKSDSEKPKIIPLFTKSEYDLVNEDMGLYLSPAGYDLILSPLALSDSISTIYFSPMGIINTIAIESLRDKSGVLASDKWNFVRLSTTKELINRTPNHDVNHIALYGGLDYERRCFKEDNHNVMYSYKKTKASRSRYIAPENLRYGVDSLEWSLPEVNTIRNLYFSKFPSAEISLFTADNGVEESLYVLQRKKLNIIHFSTHGYYWTNEVAQNRNYISFVDRAIMANGNPAEQAMLLSGLFLSGANIALKGEAIPNDIEDGVLTAKELSEMDFSGTDFVALSACQTGLGAINGDGVFGLQRGFKLAGVKTLLMSLWSVHDKATELLMIEFYKYILNGETKNSALHKAKKFVQNYSDEEYDFSDPKYWAGWILLDAVD